MGLVSSVGRTSVDLSTLRNNESVRMNMTDLLSDDLVIADASARRREELLDALAQRIAVCAPEIRIQDLRTALLEREKLGSTALEGGFALPHARLPGLTRPFAAFARSASGVNWSAPDGKPTHLVFVFVTPAEQSGVHLKLLAAASRALRDAACREQLIAATDAEGILVTLRRCETTHASAAVASGR